MLSKTQQLPDDVDSLKEIIHTQDKGPISSGSALWQEIGKIYGE